MAESPKKRRRSKVTGETSQDESSDSPAQKKQKRHKRESMENGDRQDEAPDMDTGQLTKEELKTLLDNVKNILPANDNTSYAAMVNKLDWESVKVKGYTAAFCKSQWEAIIKPIRKYRTMSEMNSDASSLIEEGNLFRLVNHPDKPKQPLTPYMRFYRHKYHKVQRRNQDLNASSLAKMIGDMYKSLSPSKKKKYVDKYLKQKAVYNEAMDKFRSEHPEYDVPERKLTTTNPMKIYFDEHLKKKYPDKSEADLRANLKDKWESLKPSRKLKYFNKAIDAKKEYDARVEKLKEKFPDRKFPMVNEGFLTKSQWNLKRQLEGMPVKPPLNAFMVFKSEILTEDKDLTAFECRAKWRDLQENDRAEYRQKSRKAHDEYRKLLQQYLETLPEEEQEKIRQDNFRFFHQEPKKKTSAVQRLHLFMVDNTEKYRKQFPTYTHEAIVRKMTQDFENQIQEEKALRQNSSKKKQLLPGEPKMPSKSVYQFFCGKVLNNPEVKGSFAKAGQLWKGLSDKKKEKYRKELNRAKEQYEEDVKVFRQKFDPAKPSRDAVPSSSGNEVISSPQTDSEEEESSGDSSSDDEGPSEPGTPSTSAANTPSRIVGVVIKGEIKEEIPEKKLNDTNEATDDDEFESGSSDSESYASATDSD